MELTVNYMASAMTSLEDIHSLSDFQRNTKQHVPRLKNSGKPAVLTVNGKAELVVLTAKAFQALAEKVERAEAIEGIRRGLADAETGRVRPVTESVEAIRKKHRIPRAS